MYLNLNLLQQQVEQLLAVEIIKFIHLQVQELLQLQMLVVLQDQIQ
jgi:hypothetical protein